jgi:hypothetical protein
MMYRSAYARKLRKSSGAHAAFSPLPTLRSGGRAPVGYTSDADRRLAPGRATVVSKSRGGA